MHKDDSLRHILDLRGGLLREDYASDGETVASIRFSSFAQPGIAVLRAQGVAATACRGALMPPAPEASATAGVEQGVEWLRVDSALGGIAAAASQGWSNGVLDRVASFVTSQDGPADRDEAVARLDDARRSGFEQLLCTHRSAWGARWDDADIVIEGDDELQQGVRFALFHLMASVATSGEAAVGARGLSGPAYGGHVFWDSDVFVLPFHAATNPASARAILEYRIRRLPAARAAAHAHGLAGARFPWESAGSGRDVTPRSARDRAGHVVPIRNGLLEEHIVADVAWAARCYVEWSGDDAFLDGPGGALLVETARYWASRIRVEHDGSAHIYGVIGPDEYHEPVDDNAYTNVMARWNLRQGAAADGVPDDERRHWRDLAEALVDGYDADTGIYEQFAGFRELEPLIIAETAAQRPITADVLLGRERTSSAQVVKQADVLMLHHLVPGEVVDGSLEANLRYYEPRTAHGSSLSPGIHAALFARARDFDRALPLLQLAARVDLDDVTATTAGGLHLATMGSVWQAIVQGIAGTRPSDGILHLDPNLPPTWPRLGLTLRFRGSRVRIEMVHDELALQASTPVVVAVGGEQFTIDDRCVRLNRHRRDWERS
jgi:trehalose/maltose hydrolase-like predicted phosphorylase